MLQLETQTQTCMFLCNSFYRLDLLSWAYVDRLVQHILAISDISNAIPQNCIYRDNVKVQSLSTVIYSFIILINDQNEKAYQRKSKRLNIANIKDGHADVSRFTLASVPGDIS